MAVADRMQRVSEWSAVLVSYLRTLPREHQGGFAQNFMDNSQAYLCGALDDATFAGMVEELKRDIKGAGRAIAAQNGRTSSGHRARGVIKLGSK